MSDVGLMMRRPGEATRPPGADGR